MTNTNYRQIIDLIKYPIITDKATRLLELTELENLTIGMEGLDGSTDEVVEYLEEANA